MCKKVLNEEHFPRKEEIIFNDERIKTSNQEMGNIIKIPKLPLHQKIKKIKFLLFKGTLCHCLNRAPLIVEPWVARSSQTWPWACWIWLPHCQGWLVGDCSLIPSQEKKKVGAGGRLRGNHIRLPLSRAPTILFGFFFSALSGTPLSSTNLKKMTKIIIKLNGNNLIWRG